MAQHLKITVLKRLYLEDLVDEFSSWSYPPCDIFEEGQVFYAPDSETMPAEFCDWAWENIKREMKSCLAGEQLPWVTQPGVFIACCTDGFRPVVFEIRRMEGELPQAT